MPLRNRLTPTPWPKNKYCRPPRRVVFSRFHNVEFLLDQVYLYRYARLDLSSRYVSGVEPDDEDAAALQMLRILVENRQNLAEGNVIHRLPKQNYVEFLRRCVPKEIGTGKTIFVRSAVLLCPRHRLSQRRLRNVNANVCGVGVCGQFIRSVSRPAAEIKDAPVLGIFFEVRVDAVSNRVI